MRHDRIRRRAFLAVLVLVALVAAGLVARRMWLHDSASSVDADEAVDRYHDLTTTIETPVTGSTKVTSTDTAPPTTAPATTLPSPGVYRYTTSGREHIDVLGGATHDYPAETYLTVTAEGCGVRLRWDLLEQRRDEWLLCATPDGIALQPDGVFYHEFFGRGELQQLRCDREVVVVPADHRPRDVVPLACALDTDVWLPEWQVLEWTTRTVGGREVAVQHVRKTVENSSAEFEHTTIDFWLDVHGLPVAITSVSTSRTDTDIVGAVVYDEVIAADLVSLTPMG